MKGFWIWPSDEKSQARVMDLLRGTVLVDVLAALSKDKGGLSNAQLDLLLDNNSQWNSLWTMRQLLALGFAEYRVNVFGDSGRYLMTELGQKVLDRMTGKPQQPSPPAAQTAVPRPQASAAAATTTTAAAPQAQPAAAKPA